MPSTQESLTDTLRQMAGGFSLTQVLYTAVKLGVADHLANGPKQAHELAQAVNASPQALYRFLRMMVVLNLLVQENEGGFRLSPLGDLLRSDHPDSMRNRILYIGEVNYRAAQGMLHAVQKGEPAFDHIFGMSFFDYFAQHPHIGALFNDLLSRGIDDRVAGVVAAYDFSRASTIVDVGGGNGALLIAILRAHPHLRGIIFDMPKVVVEAQHYLAQNGVADRCQTIAGDFFHDTVPPGGALYLMSNIIHDWDDERAAQILRNCRAAMRDDSTLLLIEEIMPERVVDAPVTVSSDLSMLLLTRGRERTEAEYRALLAMAGLQLTAIIPFEPTRIYSGRKPNWAIIESKPPNK
ncbi:MAG: methyltransferase [Candidatus Aminicenantales bacterium]